jgi:hypothetical protein
MLALSASPLTTSHLKDSIMNQIQHLEITAPVDSTLLKDQSNSGIIPKRAKGGGTFRATELYWNKDNMELDFIGTVRVDFKAQHFQGTGKFNFLGKVYLLIVDGQQVAMGKTIKLSDQDYNLTELDSKEAISKYGDAGKNGAVVIEASK